MRRYLLHVPMLYLNVVRYYGLYSSNKKDDLNKVKKQIGQKIIDGDIELSWQDYCEEKGDKHPERCPVCGKKLIRGRRFTAKELKSEKNKFIIEKLEKAA